MPWEYAIRQDIRERLLATGQFDDVWTTGLPEQYGQNSSLYCTAAVSPASGDAVSRWDDMSLQEDIQVPLTILVRNPDVDARDRLMGLLKETAESVLTGQSLAGITCPDLTILRKWRPGPVKHPESRLTAVIQYTALLDNAAQAVTDNPS